MREVELMASRDRYIPEIRGRDASYRLLPPEPNYRLAMEAAEKFLAEGQAPDWVRDPEIHVLIDVAEVDLDDRDVMLNLMAYDPLMRTVFDFARTQGGAGLSELAGGPDAHAAWRQTREAIAGGQRSGLQVKGSERLAVNGGSRRVTALSDFRALLNLARQALLENAEEEHGQLSEEGTDRLEFQTMQQARAMLGALGVTDAELVAAGLVLPPQPPSFLAGGQ